MVPVFFNLSFFLCRNVLVFDMGGTSVNTSIVSVVGGLYRIVASYSNDNLGGVSFDKAITRHFAAEFQR